MRAPGKREPGSGRAPEPRPAVLVTTSTFPRWKDDTDPAFVYELTRRLARQFKIYVLCPYTRGSRPFEEIEEMTVFRYRYLPFDWGTLAYDRPIQTKLRESRLRYLQVPFFLISQLWALNKIVRREEIGLLHAHWILPQGLIAAIHRRLFRGKFKLLGTIHGGDVSSFTGKLAVATRAFVVRNLDSLTVVSEGVKDALVGLGCRAPVRVRSMGVDTKMFHPSRRDADIRERHGMKGPFVLYVGRLDERKGIRYLIEAMPRILRGFPAAKLLAIGTGELAREMPGLAGRLGVARAVEFLGAKPQKELPAYYATADLFVSPSTSEGFGLTVAEAMSSGAVVVGTDLPALRDLIDHERTGFIVPPRNARELGERIVSILEMKSGLPVMRRRARDHVVRGFDWEVVAADYADWIRETLQR